MRRWKRWLLPLFGVLLALALAACDWGIIPTEGPNAPDALEAPEASTESAEPSETTESAQNTEESGTETASTEVGSETDSTEETDSAEPDRLPEHESYTSKEDVARYLHEYGHLPDNFLTKAEARALGWNGGGLEGIAPGMCIGGSRFGNYEGLLPEGHQYSECDIDTLGMDSRGAKRLVYSDDGLIYYTEDHYETFTLLYGDLDAQEQG